MLFICYRNCSTCNEIEKILIQKELTYQKRDIKDDNPTVVELKKWHEDSGLELKKFINSSGTVYREQNLKEVIPSMSLEEQYELLATDGMLVKRPILITQENEVFVGKLVKEYLATL